ncbi:MAG: alpha/beta fold hydrolase [Polyangiaceae bacterium]|nr:alpha/beta fold hydrolase [Polyangiaceae bacterium]MCW5791416.1 alpha/beta fold hydrolase [Polyangiaceae bacterium]
MASSAGKAESGVRTGRVQAGTAGWLGAGDPSTRVSEGKAPALLALHGFGGTPVEVELLVEVAGRLGLAARAPLLPGHGTHPRDLGRTRYRDWLRGAEDALSELFTAHGEAPVIVCGLSMGSLLALELSLRYPERVARLVLLANALWLRSPFPERALAFADRLGLPDFQVPKQASDLGDPAARRTHLTYAAQPLHAAISLHRAAKALRPRLSEVTCPTFIVHGARDRLCPVANADRAARGLTSAEVEVLILPRSHHILTRDVERSELAERLTASLRPLTAH